MSEPTLYDLALVKYEDPANPGNYLTLCGIVGVQVNESVETQERRVRDCAAPNKPGVRRMKTIGINWSVTGSGRTNADQRAAIKADLLGKKIAYRFEYYADDGTDAGDLLGTDAGTAIMTANNMNIDVDAGTSDLDMTWEGEGDLAYTPAA